MRQLVCATLLCLSPGNPVAGGQQLRPPADADTTMAIPASSASLESLLGRFPGRDFLTFPEHRENPIRLFDGIPEIWTKRAPEEMQRFEASAAPGEYFVFQIGVFAHRKDLAHLQATWTALEGSPGIPASAVTCFNTSGVDYTGRAFSKEVYVAVGRVQPLWFGVRVPANARGTYRMRVRVAAAGTEAVDVQVVLTVAGDPLVNSGFDRGRGLSRLAWLNTTIGREDNPTKGLEAIRRSGSTLRILGRTLVVGSDGLPSRVVSHFEPSNQFLVSDGEPLLGGPFRFVVEREDGEPVRLDAGPLQFSGQTPSAVSWRVTGTSPECDVVCSARMEFDGFIDYRLTLKSKRSSRFRDVRLEVPMKKAGYMMGLGREGGVRPPEWSWRWDTTRHQDALWVGDVNGGIRLKWKAENYRRPLINLYYAYGRLRLPDSWGNRGRGGVRVAGSSGQALVTAFSGSREVKAGQELNFDFEMQITPCRAVDRKVRFGDRYFHGGGTSSGRKLQMAEEVGANIVNIHHAEDIYPFINYPYLDENVAALRQLAEEAHRRNKRLKLYYTTRELTKNLPEFWALFSLDGEVIFPGPGNACSTLINPKGPDEWLKRNLKERYIPAWLNLIKEGPFRGELDLSVITTPDSRLNNFYCGGLDWMLEHLGIDGVYIDDSALDRVTLRRARTLIDRHRPEGRIDFHSWNHFNAMAGYASCLNLYMDLLPYVDLVWIGEQRNYDRMPDHWLVEVSGIPFGLTGQMLEGGGNPWRGMVYGITNRAGWSGDPPQVWAFWDEHRIAEKRMRGYWDRSCPVSCSGDSIRATVYQGRDESVIALANWGTADGACTLRVDWKALGLDPSACSLSIPQIPKFQEARTLTSLDRITVPARKGYLIVVRSARPE